MSRWCRAEVLHGQPRASIDLLMDREMTAQALADRFDVSFPAVSQHLGVLLETRLVTCRSDGRYRVYRARPRGLRPVHRWTAKYEKFWKGRLRRLGQYLDGRASRASSP